jgi:glycerate 2-kinase
MKFYTLKIFKECLKLAQPSALVSKNLLKITNGSIIINSDLVLDYNRIKFISFGKSGGSMAEAFLKTIGTENISEGIIVLPKYATMPRIGSDKIQIINSTHPFVSEQSAIAGNKVLEFADRCDKNDIVFCLVSGGGSALLASPINKITIQEKINLINKLIKKGIGEREVNILRKKLSRIKGGALAKKIYPSRIINLILSDEREHQLEAIASGPTVENKSSISAEEIMDEFQLWGYIPEKIHEVFKEKKSKGNKYPIVNSYIIGSRDNIMKKIKNIAIQFDIKNTMTITKFYDKNIMKVKKDLLSIYSKYYQKLKSGKHLIVACGEVPIAVESNSGKGGRNQHLAALMINELRNFNNFEFLAISSDGCDFINGVHGAIISDKHLKIIDSMELNIHDYISKFNSYELHNKIGSLIKGPMTGTNINDFYLFYFEK